MCGCEHHWDRNAPCTCTCPDHKAVREEMSRNAPMSATDHTLTDAEPDAGNLRYIAKHAYDGERCVWCGINIYDAAEDDPCVDHEPITYTTETKPRSPRADGTHPMSATDHTLTDAERAMFERIEDTGDTQGLTWRVQELVTEARALADEESASRVALANQLIAAEAEKEALRAERDEWLRLYEGIQPDWESWVRRAEAAEAALAGLVAAVEALAGEWDEVANKWHYAVWHESQKANARDLRALIPAREEGRADG